VVARPNRIESGRLGAARRIDNSHGGDERAVVVELGSESHCSSTSLLIGAVALDSEHPSTPIGSTLPLGALAGTALDPTFGVASVTHDPIRAVAANGSRW
jgi:hypothetical protein